MSKTVIKVEGVGKQYRLGEIGTGTISHDLNRWWAKLRGKEDPFAKIGEANDRTTKGDTDYVWALKDINFEVKQGEVLGIIGRNGAGKSTLLKLLSQVTKPTTGKIKIKGRIASLLEVGTGFHPEMTGRENIFMNGAILGMTKSEIRKKFDDIVDFAGVERYIDTPVKRYSSGMYVRLAFSVAAHLESDILIVDEVLAVGDAEFQKKCIGKMGAVSRREGRTVLFVSHNLSSMRELCSTGIVLRNGFVEASGNIIETINYYSLDHFNLNKQFLDLSIHRGLMQYCFITEMKLSDEKKNVSKNTFYLGETILIELKFKIIQQITSGELGITISSISGVALAYFVSKWEGEKDNFQEGNYECNIVIPKFPFFPGKYILSPWFLETGQAADDHVPDAIIIEIINDKTINEYNPFFERYSYSGCETYIPSKWSIQLTN